MRFAVLSDIHGNPIALDAVLAHAQQYSVDGFCVLGDLVAIGSHPAETLQRLAALPNAHFVQGNTDRYVLTGARPYPRLEDARANPTLLRRLVQVEGSFAWTQGALAATGWLTWLTQLPLEQHFSVGSKRMHLVHVAPGRDDGLGFHPDQPASQQSMLLGDCDADLLLVGHTHAPVDVHVGRTRVVNPGSVSNPFSVDLRASYAIVDVTDAAIEVTHHRVAYDLDAAIRAFDGLCHPAAEYVIDHFKGHRHPWWTSAEGRAEIERQSTREASSATAG